MGWSWGNEFMVSLSSSQSVYVGLGEISPLLGVVGVSGGSHDDLDSF